MIWKNGIYRNQVVVDHLKDELRDNAKSDFPRLFTGSSIEDIISIKMLLGHFMAFTKLHIASGSSCIGINAHSYNWTFLANKLFKYGRNRVIGGDISSLDMSTQRFFALVMYHCLKYYLNFQDDDPLGKACMGICFMLVTTVHIQGVNTYLCTWRNASGNFLTGFMNTITTWTSLWCCYQSLRPKSCEMDFQEATSLGVYGDDNLGSVHPDIHFFHNISIQSEFKSLFGQSFTDPKKGDKLDNFLAEDDQVFLARKFEFRDGRYDAPLEEDCILGMLHYVRPKELGLEKQTLQNVDAAKMELSHYESKRARVIERLIDSALSKVGYEQTALSVDQWRIKRLEVFSDGFSLRS